MYKFEDQSFSWYVVSKFQAMASFDYIDALYRSRITLMKILTLRGYEVSAYNRFSPKEVEAMSPDHSIASAGFMVSHTTDPKKKCLVVYYMNKFKSSSKVLDIIVQTSGMKGSGSDGAYENELQRIGYENLEVIVMTGDIITETHKTLALQEWSRRKLSVSFFGIYQTINNPMEHVLVPKHERVGEEEEVEVMKLVQSKAQLPVIKYHLDPIARCLGLTPGELVKITRSSPSAGVYVVYRVCAP